MLLFCVGVSLVSRIANGSGREVEVTRPVRIVSAVSTFGLTGIHLYFWSVVYSLYMQLSARSSVLLTREVGLYS